MLMAQHKIIGNLSTNCHNMSTVESYDYRLSRLFSTRTPNILKNIAKHTLMMAEFVFVLQWSESLDVF